MDLDGVIALQVHAGKNVNVRFRNIRLQDLGTPIWKRIWDGKTFSGWHPIGKGEWKIADGVISGKHAQSEKEFGHLVTDADLQGFYRAFEIQSGEPATVDFIFASKKKVSAASLVFRRRSTRTKGRRRSLRNEWPRLGFPTEAGRCQEMV